MDPDEVRRIVRDLAAKQQACATPIEADDDPFLLARRFLGQRCSHADGPTLRFRAGEWYRWTSVCWRPVSDEEVRSEVTQFAKGEFDRLSMEAQARGDEKHRTARKVTVTAVGNILQALKSLVRIAANNDPPFWIGGKGPFPADTLLVARNGIVHIPSFATGNRQVLPLTPRLFTTTALDYDIDPDAKPPEEFLAFLRQLWHDDQASIDTLQEWAGYSLFADTRQQKILLGIGPTRCGKGTISRVLTGLVGPDYVAGPTLTSLSTNFGLAQLLGKSLAIIPDAHLSGRSDQAAIVDRLLSISGEDRLTIDRKYLPPVHGKLTARLVIFANELPQVMESSGALAGRMILLRFVHSFKGREDPGLTDKLLAELPGILLWAIEGWRRLRERGHFRQPASGLELLQELEDLTSPVGAFVRDCCAVDPAAVTPCQDLFRAYCGWARATGRKFIDHAATLGKHLRAVLASLRKTQRTVNGKKVWFYAGIRLNEEGTMYSMSV
jgi:putative DNA primase/helicase